MTVVDEEPVGLRPARILAKIGRTDGVPSGTPPVGYLFVDGQVEVDGDGGRSGSMPCAEARSAPAPCLGILPADVWRCPAQQSAQAWQNAKSARRQAASSGEPADKHAPSNRSDSERRPIAPASRRPISVTGR